MAASIVRLNLNRPIHLTFARMIFCSRVMSSISVRQAGGPRSQLRDEDRTPPSGSASETNTKCQIKSELSALGKR
jgi:hypothetical protein